MSCILLPSVLSLISKQSYIAGSKWYTRGKGSTGQVKGGRPLLKTSPTQICFDSRYITRVVSEARSDLLGIIR